MTFWLMPEPEYFQAYFFQGKGEESLADFIEALRPLRMNGTLRSTVHIANDYKVINGIQQFPVGEPARFHARQCRGMANNSSSDVGTDPARCTEPGSR